LELDFGQQGSDEIRSDACPNYVSSGGNLIPSTFDDVELYNPANIFEVRAYCMFDKVIAFDETSGSIRSEY